MPSVDYPNFSERRARGRLGASSPIPPKLARAEWASGSRASLVRNDALRLLAGRGDRAGHGTRGYRRELHLVAGIIELLGIGQRATARSARHGIRPTGLLEIVDDIIHMPDVLGRLALVQFFTWFGLFAMWIYAVPAHRDGQRRGSDPTSAAYNESADWVGVMFAFYNGVAAIGALALPFSSRGSVGARRMPPACCSALRGCLGCALVTDPQWLWVPALGIGLAWASILSAPYAMVSSGVPPSRMGVYMGIHNVFLVLPHPWRRPCSAGRSIDCSAASRRGRWCWPAFPGAGRGHRADHPRSRRPTARLSEQAGRGSASRNSRREAGSGSFALYRDVSFYANFCINTASRSTLMQRSVAFLQHDTA